MIAPKVKISSFHVGENHYVDGDNRYRVKDLIKLAGDLEPFDIPLAGIPIGANPWGSASIKSFCYHVRRVQAADLSHPIILDAEGHVADGWHRISKALLQGQTHIKAVRLTVMPETV